MRRGSEHLSSPSAFAADSAAQRAVAPPWHDAVPLNPERSNFLDSTAEEYPYSPGRLDQSSSPNETFQRDFHISPSTSWTGGTVRHELPTWRKPRDVRVMPGRPITLTVQPPGSTKVITIHPHQAPATLSPAAVSGTAPGHAAKRHVRPEVPSGQWNDMSMRKRVRQVTPTPSHPLQTTKGVVRSVDMHRAFSTPNQPLEPGEIVMGSSNSDSQSNLKWCSDAGSLTPMDSSFQGTMNNTKPWTMLEYELRPSVVHSFGIGL